MRRVEGNGERGGSEYDLWTSAMVLLLVTILVDYKWKMSHVLPVNTDVAIAISKAMVARDSMIVVFLEPAGKIQLIVLIDI